ncbi:MAG: family 10 glycosylhydrolase [Lachnospiraceae bacterium]|nr:family 10 glycosylhydrolase [Lachnospiraceae bacterium]
MKKIALGLLILSLFSFSFSYYDKSIEILNYYCKNKIICAEELSVSNDKRACWISFLDIEDFLCDLDEVSYRDKIGEIYDNILSNNMNTVIFHVRPMGDAVYPSNIFPWSVYISSDRIAPDYDPLLIAIEEAHKKGLYFEAWINPYRLSKNNETTESFKNTSFYEDNVDIILEYVNIDGETCLCFDPAKEKSKIIICEGVAEIVENYDVDAIHFDDYFYVDGMGNGLTTEEKKTYVNDMIASVYKTVKNVNSSCQFGISPAGNPDNAEADGADIDTWLSEEGYVDYIMPQLYWTDEYISSDGEEIALFSERCAKWQSINKLNKPIYAGLALYKSGEKYDGDKGWDIYDDNLKKQCDKAYQMGYDGYALFRYAWLENSISSNELDNLNDYVETLSFTKKTDTNINTGNNNLTENNIGCGYGIKCNVYCRGITHKSILVDGRISKISQLYKGIGAIQIIIDDEVSDTCVEYRVHNSLGVWSDWKKDGEIAGDLNCISLIDGIQIRFCNDMLDKYDLFYRIGYFDGYLTKWKNNGDIAGDIGLRGAISFIDFKLIEK